MKNKMTNLISKLTKLAMIPLIVGGLNSCKDASNDFCKKGKYNGYDVSVYFNGYRRGILVYSESINGFFGKKAKISGNEALMDL